jgi:hypothetical protein
MASRALNRCFLATLIAVAGLCEYRRETGDCSDCGVPLSPLSGRVVN